MNNLVLSNLLLGVRAHVYVPFIRLPFIFTNSASVITPWSLSFASLDNSSAMDVTVSLLDRILLVSSSLSTVSDCTWTDDSCRLEDVEEEVFTTLHSRS